MRNKFFIVILISIFIVGCEGGSYYVLKGEVDGKSNSMIGSYEKFDGEYYKVTKIKDAKKISLNFKINTKKGKLGIKIISPDEKVIFEKLNIKKSFNEDIEIYKEGKYKMVVLATDHSGSFNLKWRYNYK